MPVPDGAGRVRLMPHPAVPARAARAISACVERPNAGTLVLAYRLEGGLDAVVIPCAATPAFREGLWRHTCFEVFVATDPADGYLEFNLSPSGEWAAFAFSGYRAGMTSLEDTVQPSIECRRQGEGLVLQARLPMLALPGPRKSPGPPGRPVVPGVPLRLALAVVVERVDGQLEYWALAHPAPRPDFHDPAAFALTVDAPAN